MVLYAFLIVFVPFPFVVYGNSMVSAPDHLPFIYHSSLDHLEIGHRNGKLDFLLVTCIPQFSQQDLSKSSRV